MDWRAIILAIVGIIALPLYSELIGWSPDFPIMEGTFVQLLQWAFGWILALLGLPAAGVAVDRLFLNLKIKNLKGETFKLANKYVKEA
jgi:hypothetical protein